jgi:hypothetical protein
MQLVGKVHNVKILCLQTIECSSVIQLFPSILQLLIFFGTGLEVLRAMRIHSVICVRTPCSLELGYE